MIRTPLILVTALAAVGAADIATASASFQPGALARTGQPFPAANAQPASETIVLRDEVHGSISHGLYHANHPTGIWPAGEQIARTNGQGDDGEATNLYLYKNLDWRNTVPMVYGTYAGTGKPMIWTPAFNGGGVTVYSVYTQESEAPAYKPGTFKAPTAANATVTIGAFSATNVGRRVQIYKNGQLIGRTNGEGNDGILLGLAVLPVRTAIADDGQGKIQSVFTQVPIVITDWYRNGKNLLQTPANNLKYGIGGIKGVDTIGVAHELPVSNG